MFRNPWKLVVLAIVGGTILLTPGTSDAQRRRRGFNTQGWEYAPGGYYNGSTEGTQIIDEGNPSSQFSFYPDSQNMNRRGLTNPNDAGFILRLPDANAEVWFENHKTQQRGLLRQYESDALQPNQTYTFHIRARWTQNGKQMDQTKEVQARAGQNVTVNFAGSDREQIPAGRQQNQGNKLRQNQQNQTGNPDQP